MNEHNKDSKKQSGVSQVRVVLGKDAVESVLYALVIELENMEKQDAQQK